MEAFLAQLYKTVNNLQGLRHPVWQREFSYLHDQDMIELADSALHSISTSGARIIFVAETGASPYADICQKIASLKDLKLIWKRIKFPREPKESIFVVLAHFLREEESQHPLTVKQVAQLTADGWIEKNLADVSRLNCLREICSRMPPDFFATDPPDVMALLTQLSYQCSSNFQKATAVVFADTEIAGLLSQPVIYFDEYIDSGTTFRNALTYLRCFRNTLDLQTVSYYIRPPAARLHNRVRHACYTEEDKPACFDRGAYPYENRIDLIGHYYFITNQTYRRIEVASLCDQQNQLWRQGPGGLFDMRIDCRPPEHGRNNLAKQFSNEPSARRSGFENHDDFCDLLHQIITRNCLLPQLQKQFSIDQVAHFITNEHIMRYCLYRLEQITGFPETAEFLFQLFDMYGPAWTPMPVSFHFDFWHAFEGFDSLIEQLPEFSQLIHSYRNCRTSVLDHVATICTTRRQTWLTEINNKLENIYGQQHQRGSDRSSAAIESIERKDHRHFHGVKREDRSLDRRSPTQTDTRVPATRSHL